MAKLGTDFTEHTAGVDLLTEDWSVAWSDGNYELTAADIDDSGTPRRVWQLDRTVTGANNRNGFIWDAVGQVDEGAIYARFRIANQAGGNDMQQVIAANMVESGGGENSVFVEVSTSDNSGVLRISHYDGGTFNSNISGETAFAFAEGEWINLLFDFRTANFEVRAWTGDRYDDSAAVSASTTKPSTLTGGVGCQVFNSTVIYQMDFLGFSDDGDPPRSMADLDGPSLSNPVGTADGETGFTGSVDTDTATGTLYYLATESSTASATEVKAGSSQAVTATGTQNVSGSGLTAGTTYYLHYLHEADGEESAVTTSASFTTDADAVAAPTVAPVVDSTVSTTSTTATATASYDDTDNTGDPPDGYEYRLDGGTITDIGDPTPLEWTETGLTAETTYNTPGFELRAYNSGGAGPWSDPVAFTTDEAGTALEITGNFDSGNLDAANSSVTGADTAEPDVFIMPRSTQTGTSSRWKVPHVRLDNSLDKRPLFSIDVGDKAGSPGDFWPWFTTEDPEQSSTVWQRFSTSPTNEGSSVYSFQHDTAFTSNTVWVAAFPAYPIARDLAFIEEMKAAHPDRVHRLPSLTDPADWAGGYLDPQTDEQGRTIPSQPMRGYGVWDGTAYPDTGLPKPTVVFTVGVHAGEVLGDWIYESAVRFLLSGDPVAERLLQNFQFVVYPNVNPAGRWGGHQRGQWDPADSTKDPNRDWQDNTLNSTQTAKAMMAKDIAGRKVVLWCDFHSWASSGGGRGSEPSFYLANVAADSAFVSTWQGALTAYGSYNYNDFDTPDSIDAYALRDYGGRHAYTVEGKEYESYPSIDAWAVAGEHWMRTLDDINEGADADQVAFSGRYLALDFTGSGVGAEGLFDLMASGSACCEDEPLKTERGLGVDDQGQWRADMNAVSEAEVFLLVTDAEYVSRGSERTHGAYHTIQETT